MRTYNTPFGVKLEEARFSDDFYTLLEDEEILKARDAIQNWCETYREDESTGFFLASPNAGRCKTSLMACAYNYFKDRGLKADCTNMSEYMYFFKHDDEGYKHILDSKFLLFDDIGVDFFTGFKGDEMNSVLYDLINYRYNNNLTTCFSSNYTFDELVTKKSITRQTVDRIKGMTAGNWQIISGGSVRERSDIRMLEVEAKKRRDARKASIEEHEEQLDPVETQLRAETIMKAREYLERIRRRGSV